MRTCVLAVLIVAGSAVAQASLAELPGVARERAARQRPVQEAALKPFLVDLSLDYRSNVQHLEGRIAAAAALGDAVVPLLLEKLTPADGSGSARNLAGNCRRVLQKLDPASFLDALIELINGPNEVAREEALRLLGNANTPRAAQLLQDRLQLAKGDEVLLIVRSLTNLGAPSAAPAVVRMLGSEDRRMREAVLDYLVASKPASVVKTVVQGLAVEKDNRLLPLYVEYFAATASANDEVATALVPLLERDRLDWKDSGKLVQALATIAPKGHEPTCARLRQMLDQEDPGTLGLHAALTLQALGDKKGLDRLDKALTDQMNKQSRRRDANLYVQRGDLQFAREQWDKAKEDYKNAVEYSTSTTLTRRARQQMARCEARRRHWKEVLELLQQSEPTYDELIDLAKTDPAIGEALQQEKIRLWLNRLKEGGKEAGK
jgi:tetratricopeptide (TPR) repeat protein